MRRTLGRAVVSLMAPRDTARAEHGPPWELRQTARRTPLARSSMEWILLRFTLNTISEARMQIGVESSRAVENKRVFVIDSDEITRAALQFMLHDENETHELPGVGEAYAKAVSWRPDVILLGMPIVQEQGIGVIGEIRERIPGVKIAVVTDSAADATAQSCLEHGAHSLLARPLTIEAVRRKVDILLGRRTSLSIPVQVT